MAKRLSLTVLTAIAACSLFSAVTAGAQVQSTERLLTPRPATRPQNGYTAMPETTRQTYWMRGNDQLDRGNAALKSGNYAKACKAFKEAQKAFENSGHDDLSRQSADFADEACAHAQA